MASVTEELNFKFYSLLINLSLKCDTRFGYWKPFLYVWSKLSNEIYFLAIHLIKSKCKTSISNEVQVEIYFK